jgi:hypothetical protein
LPLREFTKPLQTGIARCESIYCAKKKKKKKMYLLKHLVKTETQNDTSSY